MQDDLTRMLGVLPEDVRGMVRDHPQRKHLLEIVLDLGRAPEARFLGDIGSVFLREAPGRRRSLDARTPWGISVAITERASRGRCIGSRAFETDADASSA